MDEKLEEQINSIYDRDRPNKLEFAWDAESGVLTVIAVRVE